MACLIQKDPFGKTSQGDDVYKFTLKNNNNVTITILNYGCVVYEIKTPDKDGRVVDINLGFDNVKDYEVNSNHFGALVGRVANRVGNAQFTLDGTTYHVSKNDPFGGHLVHGGFVGFSRRVWDWRINDAELTLSHTDPDGSEGFPGEVLTHVTFTLDDENVLTMDYTSTTSKATPIDMGSHFMVNLAGHGAGDIRDHVTTIYSDRYLEMGDNFLPTGKFVDVAGTVMDFRKPRLLDGDTLESLTGGVAFHHAFCVGDPEGENRREKKFVARVEHPATKRYMEVYSTCSTVFAYGNHFMDIMMKGAPCKDGVIYRQYAAIEFMPMGYPNAINQDNFPTSVIKPGETYRETSCYKFGLSE